MNKKLIRLTESDLHRIVKESANKILKEYFNPNNDGTFKDMDDGSKYEVNGTYYDDDMEAIKKREKVMMDYCQQVIWACHQQGILPDLLKTMRDFEKKHDIDTATGDYEPLNRAPMLYHNCSFSPSAERTPKY